MTKPKVFITGGDQIGWAVDEDLKLTRRAIESIVDLVELPEADIVHSLWWYGLLEHPEEHLKGKRIICHVTGEPFRYLSLPEHRRASNVVGRWVTRTAQAARQLESIGIKNDLVPYLIDTNLFKPISAHDLSIKNLRDRLNLPQDCYLIGSFQRDTEGVDLKTPKAAKGPDILLEILIGMRHRGHKFHMVLAGPRRHWIIKRLKEEKIPFSYLGQEVEHDDLSVNTVERSTLNLLYNLIDLYIVASRSEGGPHAILEAAASRCKIISTSVGMAPDVLDPICIYNSPPDAVELIERDLSKNILDKTLDKHYDRIFTTHTPEAATPLFQKIYDEIQEVPIYSFNFSTCNSNSHTRRSNQKSERPLTVGLWHKFFTPPYGGGNQFMMALRKALSRRGMIIKENELDESIDVYILNSIHFDVDLFLEFSRSHRLNVIHRIDGPIHLIRGFDREKDELCYDLNAKFASATVIQSAWTYQRIVEMGYDPVSPIIIHNGVDSDIFHSRGRIAFDTERKIRLISTSWSNNPRKGGPIYKWIEDHLDWSRFDYTFVGNASESFHKIKHIPPVPSEQLAEILRQHDIYITASQNDPCSNALIEALACGLPALYFNDGGHPELVGHGGLPFNSRKEIFPNLERIVQNYESFQRLIVVPKMEDVAAKYLALLREVTE